MTPDLEQRFAELAAHAHRTGRPVDAATVRARGDRKRRNRGAALLILAAIAGGTLLVGVAGVRATSQDDGDPAAGGSPAVSVPVSGEPVASAPGPSAVPTPTGTGGPLSGTRALLLQPFDGDEELPGHALGTDTEREGGRIQVTDRRDAQSVFVPVPVGRDTYLVKTAQLLINGEASCWQRRSRDAEPATVVVAACDDGDENQLWQFTALYKNKDRQLYGVHVGDEYLLWAPENTAGLVLRRHADDELRTTFLLVDRGPAKLPR